MSVQGQILEITVVACDKLLNKEIIGRMDPYVEIEYGNTKFRTRTCTRGGRSPAFGDKFQISLVEGIREIHVSVWNSNTLRPRNFIGSCSIQLERVLVEGFDDRTWSILTKTFSYAGDLTLIMHFDEARRRQLEVRTPPPLNQSTANC